MKQLALALLALITAQAAEAKTKIAVGGQVVAGDSTTANVSVDHSWEKGAKQYVVDFDYFYKDNDGERTDHRTIRPVLQHQPWENQRLHIDCL